MTIRTTDRYLQKRSGKWLFFLGEIGKIIVITGGVFWVSRISTGAIVPFVTGISLVVLAITIEGVWIIVKSLFSHGT